MVTRAQMIGMLKDAANAIMATLTLVLQLSMSLIEMKPQMDEEEMPLALTHQLETMCQELGRQRHMLQEIVELQKRPPGAALGSPSGTDLLPDPEEDSFSVIHRVADHETKPARWIQSANFGHRWNSSDPCASNTRGRSTNRDLNHGDQAGLHARSADAGSMGTKEDRLGEKAHREDLLPDSVRRHGISGLVPGKVHVLATTPEGLRGLLLRSTGARCSGSSTECPGQPVLSEPSIGSRLDPMVSKEIEDCRLACARFEPYQHAAKHDSSVSHALETAIHVADQVVAKSVPGRTSQPCHLLEIYAGEHSPLTDAVRSRGLCAHRFSKSDGDLSTFAGRHGG